MTISETKALLEDEITAREKFLRETFETYGYSRANDYMFFSIDKDTIRE